MDIEKTMKRLVDSHGFTEIYHKTSFWGERKNSKGETQEVTVDILDRGSGYGDTRYFCIVTTDDGKEASGNPASNIDQVLSIVHWYDLGK